MTMNKEELWFSTGIGSQIEPSRMSALTEEYKNLTCIIMIVSNR